MKKTSLLSFAVGLSLLEFAQADTVTSSGNITQQGAKQETISSSQHGSPPRVVKPAPAPAVPVVIVPASPGKPPSGTPAGK